MKKAFTLPVYRRKDSSPSKPSSSNVPEVTKSPNSPNSTAIIQTPQRSTRSLTREKVFNRFKCSCSNDSEHGDESPTKRNGINSDRQHADDVRSESKTVQSKLERWTVSLRKPKVGNGKSPMLPLQQITTESVRKDAEHDDNDKNTAVILSSDSLNVISHAFSFIFRLSQIKTDDV